MHVHAHASVYSISSSKISHSRICLFVKGSVKVNIVEEVRLQKTFSKSKKCIIWLSNGSNSRWNLKLIIGVC
jgi:hypothetical protein